MNFLVRSIIKSKFKNLPEDKVNMIISLVEKNPQFFQTLATKVQDKVASGLNEQEAAKQVLKDYEEEIRKMLGQ